MCRVLGPMNTRTIGPLYPMTIGPLGIPVGHHNRLSTLQFTPFLKPNRLSCRRKICRSVCKNVTITQVDMKVKSKAKNTDAPNHLKSFVTYETKKRPFQCVTFLSWQMSLEHYHEFNLTHSRHYSFWSQNCDVLEFDE